MQLNEGLERVEESCFWGTAIAQLQLPSHLTGKLATNYMELKDLVLPDWMETLPADLSNWKSIRRVVVPPSVRKIEEYVFSGCVCLQEVVLAGESRLEWIGPHAFESCGI